MAQMSQFMQTKRKPSFFRGVRFIRVLREIRGQMSSLSPLCFPWLFAFSLAVPLAHSAITASPLYADDRVVIQQPGMSRLPLNGLVEDYTGRELTIHVRTGNSLRRYARSEVIEVQTSYTAHHETGRELFASGRADEAAVELSAALKDEDRAWVRREILALLVKCALWNGDYRTAVSRFLPIADSDPETFHFSVAPLAWTAEVPSKDIRVEAQSWLAGRSPVSKLFGASHLLFDPASSDTAGAALRSLARESDIRIQRLAQMQLWRQRMQAGTATPGELTRWESAIEQLPDELRVGGYFVLGQTCLKQRQPERAAAALLRLPLVYDADRHLAARACFQSAEQLESLGDRTPATNLFSEVVFRFGDTPWGPQAETKWKTLRGNKETP